MAIADIGWAFLLVLPVGLLIMALEVRAAGAREARSTANPPCRSVVVTYGAGYGLLGWDFDEEYKEWVWAARPQKDRYVV